MKHFISTLLSIFCLVLVCSCREQQDRREVARLVSEWQGREIYFPDTSIFTKYVKDTIAYSIPENAAYKVLVYMDTSDCFSCKLNLYQWYDFVSEIKEFAEDSVVFLFYFATKDVPKVEGLLKQFFFDLPVCIDTNGSLNALNHFPPRRDFQTFLLDKDNHVIIIGNPVQNGRVKALYRESMNIQETEAMYQTQLKADPTEIDLGKTVLGQVKESMVRIENTGNYDFIPDNITTSCVCLKVEYDWESIPVGESRSLRVIYTADAIGGFLREVYIEGNVAESPLTIRLNGVAIGKSDRIF